MHVTTWVDRLHTWTYTSLQLCKLGVYLLKRTRLWWQWWFLTSSWCVYVSDLRETERAWRSVLISTHLLFLPSSFINHICFKFSVRIICNLFIFNKFCIFSRINESFRWIFSRILATHLHRQNRKIRNHLWKKPWNSKTHQQASVPVLGIWKFISCRRHKNSIY